jgi:endonuclease/exonuclease/phosphatase family metal-dependent hydrolase
MARPLSSIVSVVLAATLSACASPRQLHVPLLPDRVADPGPRERLRIVTYNVYWPRTDAARRWPALLAELRAADADVIAIQELGTWFADALDESGFVRKGGYAAARVGGETVAPHRNLLLSRFPIRSTVVRQLSAGGSAVAITRLEVNGRIVAVANVHLTSGLQRTAVRVSQLREVLSLLGDDEAILLGDFNYADGDPEASVVPASFVDAWPAVRPGDPGLTWNRERNPWADRNSHDNESSRRIDRILIRSPLLAPVDATIIGVDARAGGHPPSDHFGLVATLRDRGATLAIPPTR